MIRFRRRRETMAEKHHRRVVEIWEAEVRKRRMHVARPNGPIYLERAERCLEAARRNLDLAWKWSDGDRAPRFTIDEPTRPG